MTEDIDKLCTNNASTNVFNSFLEQLEAKVKRLETKIKKGKK